MNEDLLSIVQQMVAVEREGILSDLQRMVAVFAAAVDARGLLRVPIAKRCCGWTGPIPPSLQPNHRSHRQKSRWPSWQRSRLGPLLALTHALH